LSPGADVGGVSPSPGADVGSGLSPLSLGGDVAHRRAGRTPQASAQRAPRRPRARTCEYSGYPVWVLRGTHVATHAATHVASALQRSEPVGVGRRRSGRWREVVPEHLFRKISFSDDVSASRMQLRDYLNGLLGACIHELQECPLGCPFSVPEYPVSTPRVPLEYPREYPSSTPASTPR
jgi:hypothetical protein